MLCNLHHLFLLLLSIYIILEDNPKRKMGTIGNAVKNIPIGIGRVAHNNWGKLVICGSIGYMSKGLGRKVKSGAGKIVGKIG